MVLAEDSGTDGQRPTLWPNLPLEILSVAVQGRGRCKWSIAQFFKQKLM
jgi:hypothetical protein